MLCQKRNELMTKLGNEEKENFYQIFNIEKNNYNMTII